MNIEERVRIVEARMADHNQLFADLRQGLQRFEERVDRRFAQIDGRFAQIDGGLLALDQKVETVRHEMTRQFRWLVGIILTGVLTIAAAMLAG